MAAVATGHGTKARWLMRCQARSVTRCARRRSISPAGGPSAGALLLLATIVAVALTNTGLGQGFAAFWDNDFGTAPNGFGFSLSLLQWINDRLLTLFSLSLVSRSSASLPSAISRGWRSAALPVDGESAEWPRRRRSIS